jgi:hypothetical protein
MSVSGASAHPEFSPITTNRYLKLDLVSGDEVRLAYSVMFGAGPALAERRQADANGDGRVDDTESQAMGRRLQAQVAAKLKVTVDGQPAALTFEAPAVGLAGAEVGPSPFSVDLVARLACPGGGPSHVVVLDDGTELPQLGETEIRVEESPRTRLLESHRGAGPGAREPRIVFRGPKFSALEDRSVTVRFEPVAAQVKQAKGVGLLLPALALLAGVGFLVWRRYRSMKG